MRRGKRSRGDNSICLVSNDVIRSTVTEKNPCAKRRQERIEKIKLKRLSIDFVLNPLLLGVDCPFLRKGGNVSQELEVIHLVKKQESVKLLYL
ncbi:hypothetical protein TSUD_268090 [Trifolium subterraneum]|uniref:Uncharacterized protein n=1 Tax=Trifolium subterraneum TaxID=3900 RepID=A0A2Z6NDW3_TRISU|nr:hypothetical protein TSUD_268090 [Trifolium subterraneum]